MANNESKETEKKRGGALIDQLAENPTAHVPMTLAELDENGVLKKMGIKHDEVSNRDVNTYVRKLVGLPEKVRVSSADPEKQNMNKAMMKAIRQMSKEDLAKLAKDRGIEIPALEEKEGE